ncbi:cytochrome P450 [Streptomyces sp. NPDC058646]|uniref:cytochrome P450 n=1 Tax=Streptomyces sp. NPDC058646 TaxID=3346574 RepID=UPI0036497486
MRPAVIVPGDVGGLAGFDASLHPQDPWAYYAWFRAHRPVGWSEVHRCFFVHGHAPADTVFRSSHFTVEHPFRRSRQALGPTLLDTDGPDHTRLRPFVNADLTGNAVRTLIERVVRPAAAELAAAMAASGGGDFVEDFASELPLRVAVALTGLDPADRYWLADRLRPLVDCLDRTTAPLGPAADARDALEAHTAEVLRRGLGRGGLLGRCAQADGLDLSEEEIVRTATLLLSAGTETTVCSLANAVVCLLTVDDVQDDLREGRVSVADFVREVLRWQPPMHFTLRYARQDTELGGVAIPAGAAVQLNLASANRDESVFANADRFVPGRSERSELTFGRGRHSCPGNRLAAAEIEYAVDELLARTTALTSPDGAVPPVEGVTFRRPRSLPVLLRSTR